MFSYTMLTSLFQIFQKMSGELRYVLLKLYMSQTLDQIENVFTATKHNYSLLQCQKMTKALSEARNLLGSLHIGNTETPEAFLDFGQRLHSIFEELKNY